MPSTKWLPILVIMALMLRATGRAELDEGRSSSLPPGAIGRLSNSGVDPIISVVFSPDGQTLASRSVDGEVQLWEARNRKSLGVIVPKTKREGDSLLPMQFSSGGDALLTVDGDHRVRRWSLEGRGPLGEFLLPFSTMRFSEAALHFPWVTLAGEKPDTLLIYDFSAGRAGKQWSWQQGEREDSRYPQTRGVFSSNGKWFATANSDGSISLGCVATGKEYRHLHGFQALVNAVAFSPDARLLAAAGGQVEIHGRVYDNDLRVWEIETGMELFAIKGRQEPKFPRIFHRVGPNGFLPVDDLQDDTFPRLGHSWVVNSVSFCGGGRLLASAGSDGTLRIWEVASGKEVLRLRDAGKTPCTVCTSPDGNAVATVMSDGSVILWDVSPLGWKPPEQRLSRRQLTRYWADLASANAADAYRAVYDLTAAPADAIPFIRGYTCERQNVSPELILKLIEQMDAGDFHTREDATNELAVIGRAAENSLRNAIGKTLSPETRRRVNRLLDALNGTSESLRSVRATWVLERIGTPEARKLLADLAEGVPETCLTLHARSALERLKK